MYSTALSGSSRRNSAHSWAASVLLGLSTSTGRCSCSTAQAMTLVLPLPVTPSSTCWLSPERTPSTSCSIASGWSPAGLKGASTRKVEVTGHLILRRTDVRTRDRITPALSTYERPDTRQSRRDQRQGHRQPQREAEGAGEAEARGRQERCARRQGRPPEGLTVEPGSAPPQSTRT